MLFCFITDKSFPLRFIYNLRLAFHCQTWCQRQQQQNTMPAVLLCFIAFPPRIIGELQEQLF